MRGEGKGTKFVNKSLIKLAKVREIGEFLDKLQNDWIMEDKQDLQED